LILSFYFQKRLRDQASPKNWSKEKAFCDRVKGFQKCGAVFASLVALGVAASFAVSYSHLFSEFREASIDCEIVFQAFVTYKLRSAVRETKVQTEF
jgi:hypothetical protein